jgi:hypothetical protein
MNLDKVGTKFLSISVAEKNTSTAMFPLKRLFVDDDPIIDVVTSCDCMRGCVKFSKSVRVFEEEN